MWKISSMFCLDHKRCNMNVYLWFDLSHFRLRTTVIRLLLQVFYDWTLFVKNDFKDVHSPDIYSLYVLLHNPVDTLTSPKFCAPIQLALASVLIISHSTVCFHFDNINRIANPPWHSSGLNVSWANQIWTGECRSQSPVPYRLAIAHSYQRYFFNPSPIIRAFGFICCPVLIS